MKGGILFIICFNAIFIGGNSQNSTTTTTQDNSTGGGGDATPAGSETGTFNVKDFGVKGDGTSDDCKAIQAAWQAACNSTGSPKVVIPTGTYLTGPVQFFGPCKGVTTITVQLEGTLKASTNLEQYGNHDWIQFSWVNGLILTGGGTFDGQGAVAWPYNKCPANKKCNVLPTSLKFNAMNDTTVSGITSLNSKFFHYGLIDCQNFNASGIHITAPEDSPNTDGMHIERSSGVTIADSTIGTGDDCISIGHSNSHVTITGINCGPGHGISVGSLGKYQNEGDVNGLIVRNCTMTGTQNGVRIKTWENSPGASAATNMTFEDIVMNNVGNPIIIDQTYCPFASCEGKAPSQVKLQDISFKNIRGTSSTPVAVTLECSQGIPCQNVILEDINLQHSAGATATCQNVQAKYLGTVVPPPCKV